MPGNNIRRFFPPGDPASDPLPHLYQLFYELETREGNTGNLAANTASAFAAFLANQGSSTGGGNNVAVAFGNHSARFGNPASLYVETDRNNAVYGNNGIGWGLIEAKWVGPFESRYGDLGANDAGAFWIETSRSNLTAAPPFLQFRWDGNNWGYVEGQVSRNQNQLATLFATLGTPDANMQINVTDYHHQLQWQGSNTTWGPQDDLRAGEGPIFREVDPSPTTGWHLYDGSSVNYLNANGATASVTLPDMTSSGSAAAYLKGGSPNGGPNNPIAPVFTGNAATPSGTVSKPTLTMDPYTPSGLVSAPLISVDPVTLGAAPFAPTGALAVAQQTHSHTANSTAPSFLGDTATLTGNVSQPTFTGNSFTPAGTISNNGEPRNLVRRPWFRQ
jgi:hypothetical protein